MSDDLQLSAVWEQPCGDRKVFKGDDIVISWRKTKGLLCFDGDKGAEITRVFCGKLYTGLRPDEELSDIPACDLAVSQACRRTLLKIY